MNRIRDFVASRLHRHYFTAPGMYRHFITSGVLISIAGALMLVVLAAFRPSPDRAEARDANSEGGAAAGRLVLEVSAPAEALPGLAARIRDIPEVEMVTEVRSGLRWMTGWNAEGGEVAHPPAGYMIPVDIGAVIPDEYQEMLPGDVKAKLLDLGVGALISRTGAGLRGITDKGNLEFGGIDIPVVGVVDDELTRNHEILINDTNADGFGIRNNRYLVVAVGSGEDGREVTEEIKKHAPEGVPVKVRTPEDLGYGDGTGILGMAQIKAVFGEFAARPLPDGSIKIPQSWIDEHTSIESVPLLGEFRCNKELFPQIRGAIAEIEKQGLGELIHGGDFGGCFSARFIRSGPAGGLSRHSWGAAIDFNVSGNLMGHRPTMDDRIINIMQEWGFFWGGNWTVPDGMHFEFIRKV